MKPINIVERQGQDTDRWDPIVKELLEIVGRLATLSAAATGEALIVARIREAAMRACRAATLALPLSSYRRAD